MGYTGFNESGVTASLVRGYDAAALLPWSSPRSLDFQCFKSAVRHFCFAYYYRFSPSHSLPCLALLVLWAVITSHYIFCFVSDQSHELYPAFSERWLPAVTCITLTIKQKKNTIHDQVVEQMGVGGCLSNLSPTCLYTVCLRQWSWEHCCPLRPLSSSSHLAESRTMLDVWMRTAVRK